MVNGASAALMISDIPWNGPIGCVRLGEIDGEFVVNPTNEQMYDSTLDLIYVGSEKEMMMIEGSADQIPEERFVQALELLTNPFRTSSPLKRNWPNYAENQRKNSTWCKAPDEVLALCREITGNRMERRFSLPPSRKDKSRWTQSRKRRARHARKNSARTLTPITSKWPLKSSKRKFTGKTFSSAETSRRTRAK